MSKASQLSEASCHVLVNYSYHSDVIVQCWNRSSSIDEPAYMIMAWPLWGGRSLVKVLARDAGKA